MVNEYGSVGSYDAATGEITYSPGSAAADYAGSNLPTGATVFIGDAYKDPVTGKMVYPSYAAPAASGGSGGSPPPTEYGTLPQWIIDSQKAGFDMSAVINAWANNPGSQATYDPLTGERGYVDPWAKPPGETPPVVVPPVPDTPATCPYAGIRSIPKSIEVDPVPVVTEAPAGSDLPIQSGLSSEATVESLFGGYIAKVKAVNPSYLVLAAVVIVGLFMIIRRR